MICHTLGQSEYSSNISTDFSRSAYCKYVVVEHLLVLKSRSTLGREFLVFWLLAPHFLRVSCSLTFAQIHTHKYTRTIISDTIFYEI